MEFSIRPLTRGGQLISWGPLFFQVGAYPETIKDTMPISEGVPQIFVVPERLFDPALGVSAAELEFPVYFNFFLKSRKVRFVCRRHQLRPLLRVLKEAVFGPSTLNYAGEYATGADTWGYPDLRKEMNWYKADAKRPRGRLLLKDLFTPLIFDANGEVDVDGYMLTDLGQDRYRLSHEGESHDFCHQSPGRIRFDDSPEEGYFAPPALGLTILGSGHGFDVRSLTSGFVMWFNGKGVLVDPPVHTTEFLRQQNIDGRLVEDIILTHCHADHDSGTLQKVLQEGRVRIHTTPTVINSFVAKYRSLTGLTGQQFRQLFDYRPIPVGQKVSIAGAEFKFRYMLHSIPTLGFSALYQGRTIAYSCDTLYDPATIGKMAQEGVVSDSRAQDLLNFEWDADLIIHEAGIPPIHTPMAVLAALPEDVKERMYITHVSESAIPPGVGLRLAPPGVANTLRYCVPPPDVSHAQQMLDALAHVDLFHSMSIDRAGEFLRIASYAKYAPGDHLVCAGEKGETFHIILSGEAEIVRDGQSIKRVGRFDYIGEISLVLDRPRIADVIARSDVEALTILRRDFLDFIRGTEISELFHQAALNKTEGHWSIFEDNRLLQSLSTFQKNQLLAIMVHAELAPREALFEADSPVEYFWLLKSGAVQVTLPTGQKQDIQRGALLGRIGEDMGADQHGVSAHAQTAVEIYKLPITGMRAFFRANPGSFVRILRQQNESPAGVAL